uniref:Uncharacterized protein n=1 Tax=viral metagenome TaxID=1070528 RepID=A0A6C0JJE2_9ZZZZ
MAIPIDYLYIKIDNIFLYVLLSKNKTKQNKKTIP